MLKKNLTTTISLLLIILLGVLLLFTLFGAKQITGIVFIYVIGMILFSVVSIFSISLSKETSAESKKNKFADNIEVNKDENDVESINTDNDDTEYNVINQEILSKLGSEEIKEKYIDKFLIEFSKKYDILQSILYLKDNDKDLFSPKGKYAYFSEEDPTKFKTGENLTGQVVKNNTILNISEIPTGYMKILSGLGETEPKSLIIAPIRNNNEVIGIVEFASFSVFNKKFEDALDNTLEKVGEKLSTI